MILNLGCGSDIRKDCTNVDFRQLPGVDQVVDLSKLPWPWKDGEADGVMMLDFLEHFPYAKTERILEECWRVLRVGGRLEVQVPDLEHCARAASLTGPFNCNACGWEFPAHDLRADFMICKQCRRAWFDIAESAIHRLYGGQDYEGNWHYTAFSDLYLDRLLQAKGFEVVERPKFNQNGETYSQNWNIKMIARKTENLWGEE